MLFQFVGNMFDYCCEKDGIEWESFWEVSNIGVIKGVFFESEDYKSWCIICGFFFNSVNVIGVVLLVNVVSVFGEFLIMLIVWQEGVVVEEVIKGFVMDFIVFVVRYQLEGIFVGKDVI